MRMRNMLISREYQDPWIIHFLGMRYNEKGYSSRVPIVGLLSGIIHSVFLSTVVLADVTPATETPPERTGWFYFDPYSFYGQCFSDEGALQTAFIDRINSNPSICNFSFNGVISPWPDTDNTTNHYAWCIPEWLSDNYLYSGYAHMETQTNAYVHNWANFDCGPPESKQFHGFFRIFYYYCPQDSYFSYNGDGELVCHPNYYLTIDPIDNCTYEGNPCNPATGNKIQIETDYALPRGNIKVQRYYQSQGISDGYNGFGARWHHNYSNRMDGNTTPKYGQYTGLKSPLYSTPAKACTAGWYQLKNEAYRGMISSASARYSDGVCEITSDNSVVAVLTIGNTLSKRKDVGSNVPIHTVRRPKGNVYSFRYINGQWQVLHPAAVSLEETLTGWRFADRDGSIETYDADGKLLTIRTPTAQTTSIKYDTNGRLISVMGPYGDTLTYSYDEEQRISSIMTPEGNIQYEYDATNRLISVSYPDNSSRQYHYEDSAFPNHLTGITNENGHRFATWTYNSEGRVILSEHDGGAERVEFSYNPDGTTTVTDALGASRTYSFDVVQGELKVISITGDQCRSCPLGQMKERSYDVNGNLAKYIDWNGNITTFTRDNKGQQLSRTEAVGTSEARTITTEWHKDFPRPIRITEADRITEFTYDNEGRLLTRQVRPLK